MSRWVEVHRTHDDQELPGEGVEYITAADEERRRINRERQRRFRERVKAGAKIAVYRPRQPGATKAYTRRTKVDRGCNCTLQTVETDEREERVLRAMGIRYMLDTETGETYTLPDPMSRQWKSVKEEYECEARQRTPQGVAETLESTARRVEWMSQMEWPDSERRRAVEAAESILGFLSESKAPGGVFYTCSEDSNPMFEGERREDDIFTWNG